MLGRGLSLANLMALLVYVIKRLSFLWFVFAPLVLRATTPLYDNGEPNLANGFEITHWIEADQFILNNASIVGAVRFWDLEAGPTFQGSIFWEVYADNGSNSPGALLFSGTSANLSHVATGRAAFGYPEFVNNFNVSSISLPPGIYWLALHNGPLSNNISRNIFWETAINPSTISSVGDEAPFAGNWDSNLSDSKLAFQLFGVPEAWRPRITAITRDSGVPHITFTTLSGRFYRVEFKNNLTDASWTPVPGQQNIPGTGNPIEVIDPDPLAATLSHRFYHVVLLD